MFGTEMHLVTFIISLVQLIIFPFQWISFLARKKDKSRLRLLWLTAIFLVYNVFSGLFPDVNLFIPVIIQNILAYVIGIVLAVYFMYYIYKEFDVLSFKFLSVRHVTIILSLTFLLLFLLPYVFSHDLVFSRHLFIIVPLILAFWFFYKMLKELTRIYRATNEHQEHFRNRIYAANVGLLSICSLPILILFGDHQTVEQLCVNTGYFVIIIAYVKNLIYESNLEYKLLEKLEVQNNSIPQKQYHFKDRFNDLGLTKREEEIVKFILEGHNYKQIAQILNITEKTVSKHTSNIFKKIGVENINGLVLYFNKNQPVK